MKSAPRKSGLVTTYKLTLDDGTRFNVESTSAAQAIEEAIWANRGRTVVGCYSGMTQAECDKINSVVYKNPEDKPMRAIAGIIDFAKEITPHDPIHKDAVRPKPKRLKDQSEPLFSDDDDKRIKIESRTARYREEMGAGSSTFTP